MSDDVAAKLLDDPEAIEEFLGQEDRPPDALAYLDKAWHGIHYLLTDSDWDGEPPLDFLVSGGEPIGDIDVGYGPARAMRAAGVRLVAAALEPIDRETLERRFDPKRMTELEIYPSIWDRGDPEDLEYLLHYFEELKRFVGAAAEGDEALVLYLC